MSTLAYRKLGWITVPRLIFKQDIWPFFTYYTLGFGTEKWSVELKWRRRSSR
jgi:hypothetical protein